MTNTTNQTLSSSNQSSPVKSLTLHLNETTKNLGDLYGLFFEDINHAADGGLYAEMVQNRSFAFCEIDNPSYHPLTAWVKSDNLSWEVSNSNGASISNPQHLLANGAPLDYFYNEGFGTGMFFEANQEYFFAIRAKGISKATSIKLFLASQIDSDLDSLNETPVSSKEVPDNASGMTLSSKLASLTPVSEEITISLNSDSYEIYEGSICALQTTTKGRLVIQFTEEASISFDTISLFPKNTYKGRKYGLRKDLAEALAAMKPRFLRFPGGCLVHDGSLEASDRNSLYRWKNTLGPVFDRPARRNNWGYNQTLGLGYYEYFLLCEDLGATPLPVLPAGFNPHKGEGCDMNQIMDWVSEALDLIEFANGDVTTPWGKIRADLGHKEPFGLKYLAIGNEEIGEGFFERYPYFHDAIRAKYPEIQIINSAGPFAVGEGYETGWESARTHKSDLVDEHYYCNPEWFLANMHHYDALDEHGPGVFLGEYASWGNTYYNALVEAAYMTHLEKAKAVKLACYAPLFCNVDYKNWTPDMIFFTNSAHLLTANYHVQKMFMENQGETEIFVSNENISQHDSNFPSTITGGISIAGNDIEGKISNLVVTNPTTKEVLYSVDNLDITDKTEHDLCNVLDHDYVLEFDFDRTKGRKGLYIRIGKNEEQDHILWEFGGWDNWDCNLQYVKKGRGATISHNIFHVEDIHYHLRLEVKGLSVQTFVNGKKWNDVMVPQPVLEELYYCASKDAAGNPILKVVNVSEQEQQVSLVITDQSVAFQQALITQLSGNALTDENTFENPTLICPVESMQAVKDNQLTYCFPKHSVTVIRFA